ncbi:MAG: HAMP domain-containing protein [Cyanomargarita calcarea GSE-NOS-MK-12-04C]|jgi:signal transduction histidine kinase|uniref:histidine kinase n=1 Tax=Cyanomargarita calcarea GSE-NOS-MK-12-04C TaxID=2839659 RepID=A0A951QMR6_9CYAN|nr:HAMP domain-containing protein [Cyanomargarita calcarea GSE-NOS-MK-12-04C]
MTESFELQQRRQLDSLWVKRVFHRLSIRQKIVCGYGMVLLIVVLGTMTGLVIGDRYFQQARQEMKEADEEGNFLSSLQGVLLEIDSHQGEMLLMKSNSLAVQKKSSDIGEHLGQADKLISQLREFSQTNSQVDLQNFLNKHESKITAYLQQLRKVTQNISSLSSTPGGALKAQQLIQQFNQNPASLDFYTFVHELTDFSQTVNEQQEEADKAQNKAAVMQAQIIIGIMVFGLVFGVILALYITRAIARPISAVTNIAVRVTEEKNFDLQAPVTTADEIGGLANALNQLIQLVKQLLTEQEAENQARLVQSEKMSSLGRMLAGVAHEINNPVNFISANLVHAKDYIKDLLDLLQTYKTEIPHPPDAVVAKAEEIDLEFLRFDLLKLINSMEFGAHRTREIAVSLKDFSRIDGVQVQSVGIQACLESTLLILNNRLKQGIAVVRNYQEIPAIPGYTSLLYQVFMNLLSNAIDALEEKVAADSQFLPEITITTERLDNDWVVVRIADNGSGISSENQQKIFESFFTTKPRGVGTGLGLAISYEIVVQKHRGNITCQSELEKGTEFAITLPIRKF